MKIRNRVGLVFVMAWLIFAAVACGGGGGGDNSGTGGPPASGFTLADMQGTWNLHMATSGDGAQWAGWVYGTLTISGSGVWTWTAVNRSNGDSTLPSGSATLAITSSGIVTMAGHPSFDAVMTKDKSMIVGTTNDGGGGYDLFVMLKSGGSFALSDLQGTWPIHMLTTGNSPLYIGWLYGTCSIDASGNLTWTAVTRSNGDSTLPGASTLAISASGIVTIAGQPSFHGVMSSDKSLIVATMNDGGGGYNLMVLQKNGSGTFATGDLQGAWNIHMLTSAQTPSWLGWLYGSQSIDASGNITWTSVTRSDGYSALPSSSTYSISTAGVLTIGTQPSFNGNMSSSKSLILATMNDGGGGYNLIVCVK